MSQKLTAEISKTFKAINKATERAVVQALNDTAKSVMVNLAKFVREKYNIPASAFKDKRFIYTIKATMDNPQVTLMLTHVPIGVAKFGAKTKKGSGGGVLAKVQKGKERLYKNSFLLKFSSGNKVALHRTGEAKVLPSKGRYKDKGIKREPVERLFGPSAMELISSKVAQEEMSKVFFERYGKIFPNKLSYQLSKI